MTGRRVTAFRVVDRVEPFREPVPADAAPQVVEVWRDGRMLAALYPTLRGFKVITKHRLVVDATPSGSMLQEARIEIDP